MRATLSIVLLTLAMSAVADRSAVGQPIIENRGNRPCPDGYYGSGGSCVGFHKDTPYAVPKDARHPCPSGTHQSNGSCVLFRD